MNDNIILTREKTQQELTEKKTDWVSVYVILDDDVTLCEAH